MFLLASAPAAAQSAPAFEVASVKTAADPGRQPMFCIIPCSPGERLTVEGGRVDIRYMPLRKLIITAYRIKPYQLSGPDWMQQQHFDIMAKMPEGATAEQLPEMLQALLAERFKLASHRENKDVPVMALVVAKNGTHLEPAAADAEALAAREASAPGGRALYTGDGEAHLGDRGLTVTGASYGPLRGSPPGDGSPRFDLLAVTMAGLVDLLAPHVDRPLIDMTDLKGRYRLLVTMDLPPPPPPGAAGDGGRSGGPGPGGPLNDPLGEGFFKAIDRAGLKLEKRTAPVTTIVVDHLEKTPTEN
jgi:uncharacterized protein (TIGR03435 family)